MKPYVRGILASIVMFGAAADAGAGEYINNYLPKWVNVDLQLRHRYEWKSNFDFSNNVYDKDGFNLWRSRAGILLKPAEDVKFFYQFQDARISDDSTTGSKAAFENWADHRQAWAEVKAGLGSHEILGLDKVGFKAGRQELSYGTQRLLGAFDWSNVAQTFDAFKVMLESVKNKFVMDVFGGGKTPVKSPRETDDFYDGSANDRMIGYYGTYKGLEDVVIEQYMINRNTDGQTVSFGQTGDGEVEDYTFGVRVVGKIKGTGFDYEIDTAKQVGNSGSLDADAQMAIAIVGYTFGHAWKPRASFEFDYASGDSDPSNGKRSTFDNLYPTNHPFYGVMDLVSLQNINAYRFGLKADPTKKLSISADYHMFYLDTPKDALYAANRTIKRATRATADDAFAGNEIDVQAKYQITSYMSVAAGYSHFFAGRFLADTGANDDADFVHVQTTFNF